MHGDQPRSNRVAPSPRTRQRIEQARAQASQERQAAGFTEKPEEQIGRALALLEPPARQWTPAPTDPPRVRVAQPAGTQGDLRPSLAHHTTVTPPPKTTTSLIGSVLDASHPRTSPLATAIERLASPLPTDRVMGWVVTLAITGLAFLIRVVHLGTPKTIMFDETYYAKDAWSLLRFGYEGRWTGEDGEANAAVARGDYSFLSADGSWAVHPPLGKWLIASGEWLFGLNAFGWRFASLIAGTLMVFVVIRLARRLSHSTLIGGLAGFLLTMDGLHFVLSRIALLDIFQALFIVAGVSCVVADRDFFRNRLANRLTAEEIPGLGGIVGPVIFRPWLLAAGVFLGLGCAVKWNTIYVVAVFGILVVVWSLSARRLAGAGRNTWRGLYVDGVPGFISLVVVGFFAYLSTWIPWLRSTGAYGRDWGVNNPDAFSTRTFGEGLASWAHWHQITFDFHTGEGLAKATHTYQSSPWSWPFVGRTVGIYADNGIEPGVDGCTAAVGETCMRVVTALGTPLLWWAASVAMVFALIWWVAGMDWRFSVVVCGMAATWIPWMTVGSRPIFSFYSITMLPFMVIALAMALGVLLGPVGSNRRESGSIGAGTLVALIVLNFAFLYPILTGALIPRSHWQWRIWLPGWV